MLQELDTTRVGESGFNVLKPIIACNYGYRVKPLLGYCYLLYLGYPINGLEIHLQICLEIPISLQFMNIVSFWRIQITLVLFMALAE